MGVRIQAWLAAFIPPLLIVVMAGCGGGGRSATVAARSAGPSAAALVKDTAMPIPGGAGQGRGFVARVGKQVITKAEFEARMRMEAHAQSPQNPVYLVPPAYTSCIAALEALAAGSGANGASHPAARGEFKRRCESLYRYFAPRVLETLISGEWVIVGAEEQGLTVSDEELRQYVRTHYATKPDFAELLRMVDENIPDILWNIKVEQLATKLREKADAKAPTVTPAFVASYYSTHKAAYTTPEERDLSIVRARSLTEARRVKSELEAGTSFESIARRLKPQPPFLSTSGPASVKGLTRKVLLQNALESAIFSARPHVISGPVRLNLFPGYHPRFHKNPNDINNIDGYYVFEVQAVRPPKAQPLSQVQKHLEQELPTRLQQKALVPFIKSWRERMRRQTQCAPGYVVRKCPQYKPAKGEEPEDPYTVD